MKKLMILFSALTLSAFFAIYCSDDNGGGGNALDPTTVADAFLNPTGTITNSTASNTINEMIKALDAGDNLGGFAFTPTTRIQALVKETIKKISTQTSTCDYETMANCVSGDENGGTIDYGCLSNSGCLDLYGMTGCTMSGTVSYAIASDILTATYNNFTMNCTDPKNEVTCNGNMKFPATETTEGYSCLDLSCTVNGEQQTAYGCQKNDGSEVLVNDVVIYLNEIAVDSTCDNVCVPVKDSEGKKQVNCVVSEKDSDKCPTDPKGIEKVSTCTVTTTDAACSFVE